MIIPQKYNQLVHKNISNSKELLINLICFVLKTISSRQKHTNNYAPALQHCNTFSPVLFVFILVPLLWEKEREVTKLYFSRLVNL